MNKLLVSKEGKNEGESSSVHFVFLILRVMLEELTSIFCVGVVTLNNIFLGTREGGWSHGTHPWTNEAYPFLFSSIPPPRGNFLFSYCSKTYILQG